MEQNTITVLEPHVASRSIEGKEVWCVQIKTLSGELINLSDQTASKPVAMRDLRRIRYEMAEQWLERNASKVKKHNNKERISNRDDFFQLRMELHGRYNPLPCLPVLNHETDTIHKDDAIHWKKNKNLFIGAYIATKHPTWTVLMVNDRGFMGHELFVEKNGVTYRILFYATENTFFHDADARPVSC